MKRILVDMDGVLVDIYKRFFDLYKEETCQTMTLNEIAGLLEAEAFSNQRKWVSTPGFFRNLPVMQGSQDTLLQLLNFYEIVVVSMATEFPNCLTDKLLWLHDNFPFISWKQIVFCGDKNLVKADIMIDDHLKNLDNFSGETIMFTQPHNMLLKDPGHKRVNSWDEIKNYLMPSK